MDAAFDIFDSLNSTGLPLSAIETFKPQVQKQFKSSKFNYTGSPSKIAFENIRGIFDDLRSNQQQEESKRIVTSACYYLTGEKVVEKLFEQRKKLRALQNDFSKVGNMDAVSEALSTIAEWRIIFFSGKPTKKYNIETSVIGLSKSQIDEIKIFCDLLSQAKTVLVIPALARAWDYGKKQKNHVYFYKLLKSLTAYFSIRRYASGQTDGIDTKFRNLIKGGGNTGITGFTIKGTKDEDLPTIEEVNNYLKSNLSCKNLRFGPDNRDLWVKTVSQQNIYNASRPLTRFLVMASHTNTIVDQNQGLPTKLNAVESAERNFLTWDNWTSDIYSSIEHVAPQQGIPSEWPGVYDIPSLRNCLGNFVLLPQIQNSQLGNNNWAKKKLYFHMLVQKNKADRTSKLNEAQNAGITFRKTVQNELIDAARSSMLDGVSNTKVWNAKHITSRSLRLSEICWDLFIGWLNEN